jgi:hypothetical protein
MLDLYLGSVLHVQSVSAQLVVEVCWHYHPCYQLLLHVLYVPLELTHHANRMDGFSSYQQVPSIHLLPCMLAHLMHRCLPVYKESILYTRDTNSIYFSVSDMLHMTGVQTISVL